MSILLKTSGEMPTAGYLPQRVYSVVFCELDRYSRVSEILSFLKQKLWNHERFTAFAFLVFVQLATNGVKGLQREKTIIAETRWK